MLIRFFRTVAFCAGLILYGTASAADSYIQCPANSIESNVTTPLPSGWWSTPQGGSLSDTEIINMGGSPKLVCVYKLPSAELSVMRDTPSGMTCAPSGAGFKCQGAGAASRSGGKMTDSKVISTDGQAKADVPVKEQKAITLTPGNVKHDSSNLVRTKGSCPDLALNGVEVRMLSRDPQGQYFFRLAATVENIGRSNYRSSSGQQVVEVDRLSQGGGATRMENISFSSVPAGSRATEATHDVLRWRISQEFPPSYRFTIRFDPDIRIDGNTANDDCTVKNNSTTIRGEEINAVIRGSGI